MGRVRRYSSGPPDQDARSSAGKRAARRRGQAGRATAGGEALHRRSAARHRLGAGGPRRRFHEAPEGGGEALLPLEGDAIVGSMLDSLKELGLEKDTIVVFASDNG